MEQMIWLAPWVLTEIWLSAFETLMNVGIPFRTRPRHGQLVHTMNDASGAEFQQV